MNDFTKYVSNTVAPSANQFVFENEDENEVFEGAVFYKIFCGGKFNSKLLFSDTLDSTYAGGTVSKCNETFGDWCIKELAVAVSPNCEMPRESQFTPVTFDGKIEKCVKKGELFFTDEFVADGEKGDFICVKMKFCGKKIPYHEESTIYTLKKEKGEWVESKKIPFPSMFGCDRKVKAKVGYLGDSITQGIGVEPNSYKHWNALLSDKLGADYSYWNLGIGYARACDAATDGIWLKKAKQTDFVIICFGVNDIFQIGSVEKITKALTEIVEKLQKAGVKTLVQTVPPFDYDERCKKMWEEINRYITETLSKKTAVFDNRPFLGLSEEYPEKARYGGHPNEEGSAVWANELFEPVKKMLEEM